MGQKKAEGASLLEVLGALSSALDLVEGQNPGHATRTALIAQKIAAAMDLSDEQTETLICAAFIKDMGCSTSASRIHKIFGGDDHLTKGSIKFIDWSNPMASLRFALNYREPESGFKSWFKRFKMMFSWPRKVIDEIAEARRTAGADFAEKLGMSQELCQTIRCLDEHWDGKGVPRRLKDREIPLKSRILCAAQTMEVFASSFGISAAYRMLKEREGRWFDPNVVAAAETFGYDADFWNEFMLMAKEERRTLVHFHSRPATDEEIDRAFDVFAHIIDAKSSWTSGHSTRVATEAAAIATYLGLSPETVKTIRRAALVHDIGKLGVPNAILDKPDQLTFEETGVIRAHMKAAQQSLGEIRGFESVADIAFAHHQRLDAKGLWRGMYADDLSIEMRIIAAADVFDALVSERPYKPAYSIEEALARMEEESGHGLDSSCIGALYALHRKHNAA